MKRDVFITTLSVALLAWMPDATSSDRGAAPKRPLDLPVAGFGDAEEDEDSPETILFYGGEYEGDGFFWCLDKSCSMVGEQIEALKTEVNSAISSLSSAADIGLVAFSTNVIVWRSIPSRASSANKAAAASWVNGLEASGGTIISPAGVSTLTISHISRKRNKTVIVVGDGLPADQEEGLADITSANYESTPVNTILIQDTQGIAFMQSLASQNQGTYRFIP